MPGFSFSMVPVSGFNPQTEEAFPTGLQFQNDGTDLGLPNVDTLNFGEGTTATRGTGENANVVTVVAEGGGGGGDAPTLAVNLYGATLGAFDGVNFTDWEPHSPLSGSTDAEWDDDAQGIRYLRTGLYEVQILGYVAPDAGIWPSGDQDSTTFGSYVPGVNGPTGTSTHFRWSEGGINDSGPNYAAFNDRFLVNITAADAVRQVFLYANRYLSSAPVIFRAQVTTKRLGDAAGG